MDIARIFLTALFVFMLTTACALGVPGITTELRLFISMVGLMFGFFLGFLWNWQASEEEARSRRQEERYDQNQKILPQVVGSQCWKCNESIMFIADANICRVCDRVVCTKCEPTAVCTECRTAKIT